MLELVTRMSNHIVIRIGRLPRGMADDKASRNEQADREEARQRERMQEEARSRAHEEEPMRGDPGGRLGDLDEALERQEFPTTTDELVDAYGDYAIESQGGEETLEEVLAPTDNQTFDSADDVRSRILGLIHR